MREVTIRDALREGLREEMQRDKTVFLLGEDIGRYWGGDDLYVIARRDNF